MKKIYVGEMGTSDEASRFRMLLEDELARVGFVVSDKAGDADAVLSGVLSLRVYDDTSLARATVGLKLQSGVKVWGGDFQPKSTWFKNVKDTVKFRAENIAEKLRKDWLKSSGLKK